MAATETASLPPLVEPGPDLTAAERQRYSRHLLIPDVGMLGQRRLRAARVLVLGAGGLGSPILMYLAAAGVGTIGIIDDDAVDESNLQRQVIHGEADVGRLKVDSAADEVARINPNVIVERLPYRLTSANAVDVVGGYDVILDGTDNFATRYLVNDACVLAGKPYVWGSIFRFSGQVSVFWAAHGPNYRDLYPVPPPVGSVPSCAEGGVLGVLCSAVGSVMATEAIKLICGIGRSLLGRVLIYDALDMTYRTIELRADPDAAPVTELIDYDEFCGGGATASRPDPRGVQVAEGRDMTAIPQLVPRDLQEQLDSDQPLVLVDVREPAEHAIVAIPGDVLIPQQRIFDSAEALDLPRTVPIVLYCKSGARSQRCAQHLAASGYTNVSNLAGGVLAWIADISPQSPRY